EPQAAERAGQVSEVGAGLSGRDLAKSVERVLQRIRFCDQQRLPLGQAADARGVAFAGRYSPPYFDATETREGSVKRGIQVVALQVDLATRTYVKQSHGFAHSRLLHGGVAVGARQQPAVALDERGSRRHVLVV